MKDPAFLFYPGDYLRDTQCLSERAQVAYDRIMCEHMRNICISKQQLKFFTKRLEKEELEELMTLLTEVDGGYRIEWVADSILKRRAYSESRRKNRKGKSKSEKEDIKNISKTYDHHMKTYDNHMENEIEIEIEIENINEINKGGVGENNYLLPEFSDHEEALLKEIASFFSIREVAENMTYRKLYKAIENLKAAGELDLLIDQFMAYRQYKQQSGERLHDIEKFIGTYDAKYHDGIWYQKDWTKLKAKNGKTFDIDEFQRAVAKYSKD